MDKKDQLIRMFYSDYVALKEAAKERRVKMNALLNKILKDVGIVKE